MLYAYVSFLIYSCRQILWICDTLCVNEDVQYDGKLSHIYIEYVT